MGENRFLLFLNHLRLPYSIPKSFALLLSFHTSHHTFGSLLVDAGTGIYTVQHMLGHKNVETTQVYANMADESKRESVNRITLKPKITPQLKVVGQGYTYLLVLRFAQAQAELFRPEMKPKILFSGHTHGKMGTNRIGSHFSLYLCQAIKQRRKRRKRPSMKIILTSSMIHK